MGDWKHYPTEAVLLRSFYGGSKMSKKEERRLCVGVDLHKTQFTVSALTEDGEVILQEEYRTTPDGYSEFIEEIDNIDNYAFETINSEELKLA